MPSKHSCSRCRRPIESGNENWLLHKPYGPECIDKAVSAMSVVSLQEEMYPECICGYPPDGQSHKDECPWLVLDN